MADQRARTERAGAGEFWCGYIVVTQLDILGRNAEHIGNDLRKHGLVALAGRPGIRIEREAAVALDADFGLLLADAAGRLEKQAKPDASELAATLGLAAPLGKAFPIRSLQRSFDEPRRIGAVVIGIGRRAQREVCFAQHVAPPQLDGVDARDCCGFFDQALPQIGDVRAPGAAIRGRRRGIGEDQAMPAVNRRHVIKADGRAGRRRDGVDRFRGQRPRSRRVMRARRVRRAATGAGEQPRRDRPGVAPRHGLNSRAAE